MPFDLTTHYLGLELANPLVVAACPLTGELDVLRRLEEHGAAAAVMPSLFEEQLAQVDSPAAIPLAVPLAHVRALKDYNRGPEAYLKYVTAAKKAVAMPIIGSLNVTGPGEAMGYARRIQDAGADAMELNIYFLTTDPNTTSQQIESRYIEAIAAARDEISIPLAVKLSSSFTAFPNFATRVVKAGADGLVLFNRFLQPDIDINTMQVAPHLALSTSDELRPSLRWIGLLHGRLRASLAATSGVQTADDVIKLLLVGADATMVASTLYRNGSEILATLIDGLRYWLEKNDYIALHQIQGHLSQLKCPNPAAFERANYTQTVATFVEDNK